MMNQSRSRNFDNWDQFMIIDRMAVKIWFTAQLIQFKKMINAVAP